MGEKENISKRVRKNYSIIIAIALITILIVATIGISASKKNNDNEVMEEFLSLEFEENTERDADGNKVNISPNIKDGMIFEFLELSNISLIYGDGTTKFKANVMNNSDDEYLLGLELKITFYDNDGLEIYEESVLTNAIYARRETAIASEVSFDYSYANTFNIEIIKH